VCKHVLLRKWGDGLSARHLSNSLASLLKANGYNHVPLYIGTWGPFGGSALVRCVKVLLYEKELSYGIYMVRHTFYTAPQSTLDARIQDATHQALIAFLKNIEISTASGSVKQRSMCKKLKIFKHGREFRSERFKHYKIRASDRGVSSKAYESSYGNLVKMLMMFKMTRPWMITMWRTTSILKKTSQI
jgi:hypothetical protein